MERHGARVRWRSVRVRSLRDGRHACCPSRIHEHGGAHDDGKWVAMLVHNLYELPIGVLAVENSGPLVVAVLLLIAYLVAPTSMIVLALIAAWATLNLVVGGILTVLPLPFLPFEPEQSLSHYFAHVVYSLGQLPLLAVVAGAIHGARRGDRAEY